MSRNLTTALLALVLADFAAATGYVLYLYGPLGWIEPLLASPATLLVSVDLVIALGFAVNWMLGDAKARGVNAWPFVALTVATGSLGPLLYAVLRGLAARRAEQAAASQAAGAQAARA